MSLSAAGYFVCSYASDRVAVTVTINCRLYTYKAKYHKLILLLQYIIYTFFLMSSLRNGYLHNCISFISLPVVLRCTETTVQHNLHIKYVQWISIYIYSNVIYYRYMYILMTFSSYIYNMFLVFCNYIRKD